MTSNSKSATGSLLKKHLASAGTTQAEFARKAGLSMGYVNFVATGHRNPGPEWVDLIAEHLKLSTEQRAEMHRAAAKDHGFKIDLT